MPFDAWVRWVNSWCIHWWLNVVTVFDRLWCCLLVIADCCIVLPHSSLGCFNYHCCVDDFRCWWSRYAVVTVHCITNFLTPLYWCILIVLPTWHLVHLFVFCHWRLLLLWVYFIPSVLSCSFISVRVMPVTWPHTVWPVVFSGRPVVSWRWVGGYIYDLVISLNLLPVAWWAFVRCYRVVLPTFI